MSRDGRRPPTTRLFPGVGKKNPRAEYWRGFAAGCDNILSAWEQTLKAKKSSDPSTGDASRTPDFDCRYGFKGAHCTPWPDQVMQARGRFRRTRYGRTVTP